MKPALYRLDPPELEAFLTNRSIPFGTEANLAETLVEVLQKANEFVPSDSGSILLADPNGADSDRSQHMLTFIAAFGERGSSIVGRRIQAAQGIVGHVYTTGIAHHAHDVENDPFFEPRIDAETEYRTRSVVAVPIRIAKEVCGVLELLNRQETGLYSAQDKNLLEIFADYISISVQNALDSRQALELAKRDNLTDLYNDRHLHTALTAAIDQARRRNTDLAVLFVDLDFFKHVNDSHGHLAGSQVLREVGRLLAELVPEQLGIAARYGGDEFVLDAAGDRARGGGRPRRRDPIANRERGVLLAPGDDPAYSALPARDHLLDRDRHPRPPPRSRAPARRSEEHAAAPRRRRDVRLQGDRAQPHRGRR